MCGTDFAQTQETGYDAIDVLFIDHWKELYLRDIKLIVEDLKLLHPGSFVIADNVIYPVGSSNQHDPTPAMIFVAAIFTKNGCLFCRVPLITWSTFVPIRLSILLIMQRFWSTRMMFRTVSRCQHSLHNSFASRFLSSFVSSSKIICFFFLVAIVVLGKNFSLNSNNNYIMYIWAEKIK